MRDRGFFSRIYQETDRRKLDFNFETTAELKPDQKDRLIESFKQFRAGIGTYRVIGDTIIMKSTAIYNPNALGNEFSREFRFEGSKLVLTGTTKVAGDKVEEIWEPADAERPEGPVFCRKLSCKYCGRRNRLGV